MQLYELTRALIDIESITRNEKGVGEFLYDFLRPLAARYGGEVERMPVETDRFNVFARWGTPDVVLSTHMDTVPPFLPSREDVEFIWGRGACDAKGIIASMIHAAEGLLEQGHQNLGLLFVVGEERNSVGARCANTQPRGSRYLIDGEPTENKLALGSKGALRLEVEAGGRMAHSAYPELGDSAILKLLDALQRLRAVPLPVDPVLGEGTCNIGTITGGRAPNVIPDRASAEVMIRLVNHSGDLRQQVVAAMGDGVTARVVLEVPPVRLGTIAGIETTVVKFTTDIPELTRWGEPFLLGPGSIHVAHTGEERVPKRELVEAVGLYQQMIKELQARCHGTQD
jgi:acetylornithine deacetylase